MIFIFYVFSFIQTWQNIATNQCNYILQPDKNPVSTKNMRQLESFMIDFAANTNNCTELSIIVKNTQYRFDFPKINKILLNETFAKYKTLVDKPKYTDMNTMIATTHVSINSIYGNKLNDLFWEIYQMFPFNDTHSCDNWIASF